MLARGESSILAQKMVRCAGVRLECVKVGGWRRQEGYGEADVQRWRGRGGREASVVMPTRAEPGGYSRVLSCAGVVGATDVGKCG